jgi:hypothetical protein
MLGTGYGRVKAKARPILDDLRRSLQATRWMEPIPGVEWKGEEVPARYHVCSSAAGRGPSAHRRQVSARVASRRARLGH